MVRKQREKEAKKNKEITTCYTKDATECDG